MPKLGVRPELSLDAYKGLVVDAIRHGRGLEAHVGELLEQHGLNAGAACAPLATQRKTPAAEVYEAKAAGAGSLDAAKAYTRDD